MTANTLKDPAHRIDAHELEVASGTRTYVVAPVLSRRSENDLVRSPEAKLEEAKREVDSLTAEAARTRATLEAQITTLQGKIRQLEEEDVIFLRAVIDALNSDQMAALTTTQVAALTTQQINGLETDDLNAMNTAQYAALFAEYRLLAATGQLLSTMQIKAPAQAEAYARNEFNVPETPATETYRRVPSRQTNDLPLDLLAPIRQK